MKLKKLYLQFKPGISRYLVDNTSMIHNRELSSQHLGRKQTFLPNSSVLHIFSFVFLGLIFLDEFVVGRVRTSYSICTECLKNKLSITILLHISIKSNYAYRAPGFRHPFRNLPALCSDF